MLHAERMQLKPTDPTDSWDSRVEFHPGIDRWASRMIPSGMEAFRTRVWIRSGFRDRDCENLLAPN